MHTLNAIHILLIITSDYNLSYYYVVTVLIIVKLVLYSLFNDNKLLASQMLMSNCHLVYVSLCDIDKNNYTNKNDNTNNNVNELNINY